MAGWDWSVVLLFHILRNDVWKSLSYLERLDLHQLPAQFYYSDSAFKGTFTIQTGAAQVRDQRWAARLRRRDVKAAAFSTGNRALDEVWSSLSVSDVILICKRLRGCKEMTISESTRI